MNKDKVTIAFRIANNGYWSCKQVETKILEHISDKDVVINVTKYALDDDFIVKILINKNAVNLFNCTDFMEWCKINIVESRPLIHGFRSESSEDGYKITSVEEYDKVQAFVREKIIDKDVSIVRFHCNCGCDFGVRKSFLPPDRPFKTGLCYVSYCPVCHAICRRAIEEV